MMRLDRIMELLKVYDAILEIQYEGKTIPKVTPDIDDGALETFKGLIEDGILADLEPR
jgi:hypothetical protein